MLMESNNLTQPEVYDTSDNAQNSVPAGVPDTADRLPNPWTALSGYDFSEEPGDEWLLGLA